MFHVLDLLQQVEDKLRPPICVVMGSPRQAADIAARCSRPDLVCFQMDLHQASRLREEMQTFSGEGRVEALPDLWDLNTTFQTVIFLSPAHGERELKLDLLEQSFQILNLGGMLISLSEYARDDLLPKWHKKLFGKFGAMPASEIGSVFYSVREKDRPRRRHEMIYHARIGEGPSHEFLSRPGVFSYGRMDNGARALLECAAILPGDRILDFGCGAGANGILAMDRAGPTGHVTFLDSNVRATALAEANAKANGLTNFTIVADPGTSKLTRSSFDVILANPPYFAHSSITQRFIHDSLPLLKPGGRYYLVTKMVAEITPFVVEVYGEAFVHEHRGYTVLEAVAPGGENPSPETPTEQ